MKQCSQETATLSVINKINNKLKFFYWINKSSSPILRILLCKSLVQPHFDYSYFDWYPNLDKMMHIFHKEFETLNWLPVTERFNQGIDLIIFKYVNDQWFNYVNEVFQTALEKNIQTRGSFLKLKCLFHKTNADEMTLPYIGPAISSKIPQKFQ